MRTKFSWILLMLFSTTVGVGQTTTAFEVPGECSSLYLLTPETSPIEISKGRVIKISGGAVLEVYSMKNRSLRSIVSFAIKEFEWNGPMEWYPEIKANVGVEIYPGQEIQTYELDGISILPSDKMDSVERSKVCSRPNFTVSVVTKVVFADGAVWKDDTIYDQLLGIRERIKEKVASKANGILADRAKFDQEVKNLLETRVKNDPVQKT